MNPLILHNSQETFYKKPFGAVSTKEKINIKIKVANTLSAKNVALHLKVAERQPKIINMNQIETLTDNNYSIYQCDIVSPSTPCLMWYYFNITTKDKDLFYGNNFNNLGGIGVISENHPPAYQITVYKKGFKTPEWLKEAVMYQIFVDRFFNGNDNNKINNPKKNSLLHSHWDNDPIYIRDPERGNVIRWDFFGGNLLGIIKKLPYLKELGITVIYLNPIFESSSNHKYDTGDYKKVDEMFGDNDLFKELCQKAKDYGINVILDGVFSHTGSDSIYFNKEGNYDSLGAFQSKASPYYKWYRFNDYPNNYESWWGVESLPNVNELEPSYMDFIINDENSVSKYWIKMGAKGWRLDVVDELPDVFIKKLRNAVKKVDKDAVLIGEVWEDASNKISYGQQRKYLLGEELDSVTNYPLRSILFDFALGKINAYELHEKLMNLYENYPVEIFFSAMNILGSHDVARALTILSEMPPEDNLSLKEKYSLKMTLEQKEIGLKRLKLISLFIMTFPGMPCIYYGDEAGMSGYGDPLCRKTYPWGHENQDLLEWFKKIISLRHQYDALKTGKWFECCKDIDIYGYIRQIENQTDVFGNQKENNTLMIILNRSNIEIFKKIDISKWGNNDETVIDLLNNTIINVENGYIDVKLMPFEGKLILVS